MYWETHHWDEEAQPTCLYCGDDLEGDETAVCSRCRSLEDWEEQQAPIERYYTRRYDDWRRRRMAICAEQVLHCLTMMTMPTMTEDERVRWVDAAHEWAMSWRTYDRQGDAGRGDTRDDDDSLADL